MLSVMELTGVVVLIEQLFLFNLMTFLTDAAKYYKAESHQIAAWEALEAELSATTLEEFKRAYRTPQEPPTVSGDYIIFTKETFSKLTGYAGNLFTQVEADDCTNLFEITGFGYDPELAAMLMANILHETCNLKYMSRNC